MRKSAQTPHPEPIGTKAQLRISLLSQRRALSPADRAERSDRICQHLSQLPLLRSAPQILTYRSIRQEPDLTGFTRLVTPTWGLPRTIGSDLTWHHWQANQPDQTLTIGPFGIEEPAAHWPQLEPSPGTVILVPAIAIDRQGYRLGYGGGYYDRLFAHPAWASLTKIGITFDLGYLGPLPIDPWDIPLNAICSETGFIELSPLLPIP
jgi:5-formyltetrahydrofolate cyclo-ligase